jgi:hypothetical protein
MLIGDGQGLPVLRHWRHARGRRNDGNELALMVCLLSDIWCPAPPQVR